MQASRHAAAAEGLRRRFERLPAAVLEGLPERDRAIVRAFCGLDGTAPTPPEVLAEQFGVTQSSIHRIVRRASNRLLGDASVQQS